MGEKGDLVKEPRRSSQHGRMGRKDCGPWGPGEACAEKVGVVNSARSC